MTERQITDKLYAVIKQGETARGTGAHCPYPPNTLFSMLHVVGWVHEDLRLALMRRDPDYCFTQAQWEALI